MRFALTSLALVATSHAVDLPASCKGNFKKYTCENILGPLEPPGEPGNWKADISGIPASIKLEAAVCPASNSCHALYEGSQDYQILWPIAAKMAEQHDPKDCPMVCAEDEVVKPYLVAINTDGEQKCIDELMNPVKAKYCADPKNPIHPDTCGARPWIGGYQERFDIEPAGGWAWASGEPFYKGGCTKATCGTDYTKWMKDMVYQNFVNAFSKYFEPNNADWGTEQFLELRYDKPWKWNDRGPTDNNPPGNALYIVEFKCTKSPGTEGDPHFSTWSGEKYDFHGKCDLELMSDPEFNDGQGLAIHVRTERIENWSYVKNAAIRIGDDVFEIQGSDDPDENPYWINGVYHGELDKIGGFDIKYKPWGQKRRRFIIYLGNGSRIMLGAYLEWARVSLYKPSEKLFGNTVGMFGNYTTGKRLGRDGLTVIDNHNEFGQEWQVTPGSPKLFHNLEAPQLPFQQCIIPKVPKTSRRRLAERVVSEEEATHACSQHGIYPAERDDCILDVLALDNLEIAEGYMVEEDDENEGPVGTF